MTRSTLTTMKGTITIPKMIRDELGIKTGDRVHFERNENGKYELVKDLTLDEVREMNKQYLKKVPKMSVEEEKQLIQEGRAKEAAERYRRSIS